MSVTQDTLACLGRSPASISLPSDHHRELIAGLTGADALALYKRFTLDFHADPDLDDLTEEEANFLYERGFLPEKKRLYNLDSNNIDSYLSDMQRWLTRLVNGPYSIVFNNKVLFTQVFGRYCKVPEIIAICRNGRVIPYGSLWQEIIDGHHPQRMLVAKPLGGGGGGSVYFIRTDRDHAVVETNDEETPRTVVTLEKLAGMLADQEVPFIINEYVHQGSFSHELYPLTVNTVRMLVVRDPVTFEPYIVRAVQRIGTSESYPIDNFSLGGLSVDIDMATGRLGSAMAAEGKYRGQLLSEHPDTGERLEGRLVPHWGDVKNKIYNLFKKLPYLSYCGFDLILEDDDCVVLEGNSYSQVRLFQMHSPLLEDKNYCAFLKSRGFLNC